MRNAQPPRTPGLGRAARKPIGDSDRRSAPAGATVRGSVGSGTPGGDAKSVAVRVHQVALPPGETLFIDWDPELLRHGVDVPDIEMDQGHRDGSRCRDGRRPCVPRGTAGRCPEPQTRTREGPARTGDPTPSRTRVARTNRQPWWRRRPGEPVRLARRGTDSNSHATRLFAWRRSRGTEPEAQPATGWHRHRRRERMSVPQGIGYRS